MEYSDINYNPTDNAYINYKKKAQEQFNALPIKWAFSDEQFENILKEWNISKDEMKNELISIGSGGFMRKSEISLLKECLKNDEEKTKELLKNDEYILYGLIYELANHEYCYSYDKETVLDCLGLTVDDLDSDERINRLFCMARKYYFANCGEI